MFGSMPPGAKMEQAGCVNGDSALQLGAPGESLGSWPFLRIGGTSCPDLTNDVSTSGVFWITSRALNGALEFIRFARLSWRSVWIQNQPRTAQRPGPLGSDAASRHGCQVGGQC